MSDPYAIGERVSTTYLGQHRAGVIVGVSSATHDRGASLLVRLDGERVPVMRRPYEIVLLRTEIRRAS